MKVDRTTWNNMRPFERMIAEHGSIKEALEKCIAAGMKRPAIALKYGCTPESIKGFARRNGVELPPTNREDYNHAAGGKNDAKSRRETTEAILRGEELGRLRLMDQVKVLKPGSPDFDAVAADIFRQLQLCNKVDPDTVERMMI